MDPQQRREAVRYRSICAALDAITRPAPRAAMPEFLAAPEAVAAARTMRAVVAQPNVVAIGIAEKETNGQLTGELALTFYVEKKRDVPAAEAVPAAVPSPLVRRDVPTDVVELGVIAPEALVQKTPVVPGFSIGHRDITAGTLGALLGPRTRPRILSNSHVLAHSGLATAGDPIVYPGPLDGGVDADVVAHLAEFVPFDTSGSFVNVMDAAVATVVPGRRAELRSRIALSGTIPGDTAVPTRGMKVTKVGRTTGLTHGEVRDVNFRFVLDYGAGVGSVGFTDQVLCTRYTDGGDSGSLVLEEDTGRVVGLHFAGASGGSVFSPIRPILRRVRGRLIRVPLNEA
jgi:hypothetical protein